MAVLTTLLVLPIAAHAQVTRTWVSGVGDDLNPCSRTAPCKTFDEAQSKTAEGGEISILDPGGYGLITITKGLTVNGHNGFGGIHGLMFNAAVLVNVTTNPSTATVVLHDLNINGVQVAQDGIRYTAGANLIVDNVRIFGFAGDGIEVNGTGSLNFKASNLVIEDINGHCVKMNTSAGQVVAMIDDSRMRSCDDGGITAIARVRASVRNTVVTHSPLGVQTTGTDSIINLENMMVAFSTTAGLRTTTAAIPGRIRVSNSNISQNVLGADFSTGGAIDSMGGNSFTGNVGGEAFSSTAVKD